MYIYLLSLIAGSTDQLDGLAKNAYERRIQRLEDEKKELVRKLENSNRALQKFAHGPIVDNDVAAANESNANEIKRLQDELNTLTKRNQGKLNIFDRELSKRSLEFVTYSDFCSVFFHFCWFFAWFAYIFHFL